MNKKKIIIWALIVALLLGIGVGALVHFTKGSGETPSTGDVATKADLEAALAYIKTVYKNPSEKTPRDFQRIGVVPVNGKDYEVVWTVNVGEEHVKVVKGENGMVTIDVNEQSAQDVPYVLTATISNANGESVSYSWNHLLPMVNNDMAAIVEEAYKLEVGASMDYEVTLTGVITRINTAWSEDYQNITVTIVVAGAEGKPIECYRLKGDGAKDLQIGDTITVTGILKNYNGTIEFDSGCVLDAVVKGEAVEAPSDVEQILKDAYALETNASLKYIATLTGKITKINSPYNPSYNNVSVTIEVPGYSQYPILCYRIVGEGADNLLIGDTITVKGYIVNYEGTIEFDAGSQLIKVEKTGTEIKAPTDPDEILEDAFAMDDGETLPYKATLTGVITKIKTPYDPGYKNVTVVMKVNGKTIECYRLAGDGADKIGVDDTITVNGYLMNYHGTIQFAQGSTLVSWKDTGTDVPPADENISSTTVIPEIITAPKAGTAYKFFLYQKTLGKNLYLTGEMDGFYYATSADHTEAIDVYVEQVSGGYRLYFLKGGVKNYLEIVRQYSESTGKYHNNVIFTTKPTKVLKWNDAIKSFTCDLEIDGEKCDYYFGTYSSYQTMSGSDVTRVTGENAEALDETNFVAHLATLKETKVSEEEKAFEELRADYPGTTNPTTVTESFTRRAYYTVEGKKVQVKWTTDNSAVKIVDNGNGTVTVKIARGDEAVNFKLTATITGDGETYTTSWDYKIPAKPSENVPELPTTDGATITIEQALIFGAELDEYTTIKYKVTGKIFKVYNTQYGNMYIADEKGNVLTIYGTYNADGTVRYDEMEVKPVAGDTITVYGSLGQYNGTAQIKNGWIVEHIPGTGDDDNDKPEMTMQEIVDAAYDLAPGGMLLEDHTLTGIITSVDTPYSDTYGNVTVTIKVAGREDKPIKCYRLAGEGADKINVGDTITVTGILKNYNGTIEFDQGCTLDSYVKGENPPPTEPTTPATQPTTPSGGILVPQIVTEPQTGKAYKFFLTQKNLSKTLYLTGEMNGFYFATTESHEEAVDVYVEKVTGGYRLYFKNGSEKNYIEMARSGTHNNVIFTTTPTKVLKWNADIQSFTCDLDIDGEITDLYFGTYGTYSTFSASKISYVTGDKADTMDVTNFVAHLATMKEVAVVPTEPTTPATQPTTPSVTTPATQPTTPGTTTPATQPTEPAPGTPTYELIGKPSVGVAYKWAVDTGNIEGILAFIGTTANKDYYLSTSATMTEGVDVYVETVTGGYRMYFMAGETKTYIDIYQNGSYVNARLTDAPTAVYTWNDTFDTFVADIGGTPYYLGTYTSSSSGVTYTTLSASKLSYMNESNVNVTQFPARFYAQTGAVEPQPTTPATQPTVAPTEPTVAPTEPTVAPTEPTQAPTEEPTTAPTEPAPGMTMQEIVDAAYELANGAMMDGTQTLTGVITRVNTPYDSGYNNVTVTITVEGRDDKPIMCYRMKGEGADVIKVGDTITVTGTIKNYNGTIEFDQGCTLDSYTVGEAPEDPTEGMTMQELVDYAYQLPVGGYIDGKTLTGVITEVNIPFSSQYNNVTVTIVVEGREVKPIECFRLKGEGADVIAVGDTITVTGSLTNYEGKIEFNSGCILDSYVKAEPTPTDPTDPTVEPTEPSVAPTEPTEEPTEEPTVAPTEPVKQKVDLTGTVVGACSGNAATANSYSEFTWWSDGRPDWKPLGNFVDNDLTTYFSFGASAGERADLYLDLSKGGTGSTAVDEFTIYHSSQGDVPTIKVVLILEDGSEWTKIYETNWAQFGGNVYITEVLDETKNAV
ncbi:MAG: PT domain-containing protein, partial [Oscillospiraceae bacterium]|nr:PT domain-containing protein [Oscillospiraceae bacterium]